MSAKTASLIGATGLIGGELLQQLLNDPYFGTVSILVRRPFPLDHPKLEKKLVDFTDNDSLLVALDNSDVVFCAVGTTQKKVRGDQAAYRKVDYDIPVHIARFCKMTGCKTLVLVSSVGANSRSRNFYLRLKGETEEAVREQGPETIHVMRPSMLLGPRKELRPGEVAGKILVRPFAFLLPVKYRPIHAGEVARAMLAAAKQNQPGYNVYEYTEMKNLCKS